jgi:hypothetical protein
MCDRGRARLALTARVGDIEAHVKPTPSSAPPSRPPKTPLEAPKFTTLRELRHAFSLGGLALAHSAVPLPSSSGP